MTYRVALSNGVVLWHVRGDEWRKVDLRDHHKCPLCGTDGLLIEHAVENTESYTYSYECSRCGFQTLREHSPLVIIELIEKLVMLATRPRTFWGEINRPWDKRQVVERWVDPEKIIPKKT